MILCDCLPPDQCYHCRHCGEWGPCGCGPEVYGCTSARGCRRAWHVHGCPEERGDCDRPEVHLPASAHWPPPLSGWVL